MVVLVVLNAPPSLRGKLTRWLLQIKAGVYVGTLPARVRERVWKMTCESLRPGRRSLASALSRTGQPWAMLLFPAATEQGFDLKTFGEGPVEFEDFEGLWMAKTRSRR